MNQVLGYRFSPLREGDISLYRGSGEGLAPILLILEHEYALKSVTPAGPRDRLR